MSIADQMKIQQLEEEVKLLKMSLTQTNNIIHAAIISLDEDEVGEARELLVQAVNGD